MAQVSRHVSSPGLLRGKLADATGYLLSPPYVLRQAGTPIAGA